MIREVQASEAKTHLSRLLDDVERGDTIVVTRHGRPIARITPETDLRHKEVEDALSAIATLRRRTGSVSAAELISARDEGRR